MTRHAVVLAAGAGRRFGGGKLLASWRGEPLVRWSVRSALSARVETVTVVLGSDAGQVEAALAGITDARLKIAVADDWADGMSASLCAGLAAVPRDATSICVLLADMPAIPIGMIDALLDQIDNGVPAARPLHPEGPAHPVAFSATLLPRLASLQGDQGARAMLQALGDQVVFLPTSDPGVVFDIDRPADLSTG